MRHTLLEVNEETKTGICSICGQVRLHPRNPKAPKPKGRWRCSIQKMENKRFRETGLSVEQYKSAVLNTKSCEICGKTVSENGKKLSIDHCHTTGLFRGILCTHCNLGLGLFHDNIDIIEKAIDYLKKERKP